MILGDLERVLGFRFADQELLKLALVHSSYINEHPGSAPESNERLEFLGDALLDFVVAAELYRRYPEIPEGGLTTARSALVRGSALAETAGAMSIGELLLLGQGEERSGGRGRASNLAGAFEALLGAAYLDQGFIPARELILRILEPRLEAISRNGVVPDPKSRLQELAQRQGRPSPVYRIVQEGGPDHARRFVAEVLVEQEVLGRGSGSRKLEAEREAARAALAPLEGAA